jgi:Orn/Lys/Arg decarboxylase, C-terminal domain.
VSDKLIGKVAADTMVGCPPAVAPVVAGEVIDENVLKVLKHYNIENIEVID